MAIVQMSSYNPLNPSCLPQPANTDELAPALTTDQKIVAWLFRITARADHKPSKTLDNPSHQNTKRDAPPAIEPLDDWETVSSLCGHRREDFAAAGVGLPLTAAEIDHFRRNHRETDQLVGRDFLAAKSDLPSPLAELYGLYRHRARLDTEAALFVAQATGSTRVAHVMADLLAIGGFANAHEGITHMTLTYSVTAAFDTSDLIDRANQEAMRRLSLPVDHPAYLLKLSPDEIGLLAGSIVENNVLSGADFIEKSNLLSEARQDVNRLPASKHFITAIGERDLPIHEPWVIRICAAYARIFESWVAGLPEINAILSQSASISQR